MEVWAWRCDSESNPRASSVLKLLETNSGHTPFQLYIYFGFHLLGLLINSMTNAYTLSANCDLPMEQSALKNKTGGNDPSIFQLLYT